MHKDINHLVRMDLNLLPILDTLLNEKSVSKTADKLNVTPPAISKSLNKMGYLSGSAAGALRNEPGANAAGGAS